MRFDFKTDEELKKRIDDIALAMIDETKKHEETYLKQLKEQAFLETASFDETKHLLTSELIEIEETFCSHISSPLTLTPLSSTTSYFTQRNKGLISTEKEKQNIEFELLRE